MSETKWEWSLQKYARFKGTSQSGLPTDTGTKRIGQSKASADCIKDTKQPETSTDDEVSKWKFFDASQGPIRLLVTNTNHLVVMVGTKIQETYSLFDSHHWMTGISKGDSLLLICKHKNECRRFRVKFQGRDSEGVVSCKDAVNKLRKHFPIKTMGHGADGEQEVCPTPEPMEGEVQISQLAQGFLDGPGASLPLAYQTTNIPTGQLNTLVRLCLADVNFPEFVGSVENELKKISEEGAT